ncbi:MAG TPA: asparagine synthase-related protein [Caulobacteraceae bacterium]|nr:asparagine synthase-related protein [Caulobacteraceae bacterium]
MSGICGVVRFDGLDAVAGDVERQLRALARLGPDGAYASHAGSAAFGFRQLRIVHEDAFDAQPLSDGGLLLVADVRLDNRETLAAALAWDGALDRTPDSALVLAAYRRWGADCPTHLIGDFAFALWDAGARRLLLARDHMGQRHLFYHRGTGFLAFATETKGIWALPDAPQSLSEAGIARRLLADASGEAVNLFEGIEALPGGTSLSLDADGTVTCCRYWRPAADPAHLGRNEAYYRRAYRDVLAEAVACRLRRAQRPAALLLSGGYDSAAIAALAAPALGGRKLTAVASVLPEDRDAEPSARRWVAACAAHMPHLDVRNVTLAGDVLSSAARLSQAVDGPASPNVFALEEVCRAAATRGARVAVDGYGGDYTLNPRSGRPLARLLLAGRIGRFWTELRAHQRWRGEPLWTTIRREVLPALAPRQLARAWARYRSGLPAAGVIHPLQPSFVRAATEAGLTPPGQRRRPRATQLRAILLDILLAAQDQPTLGGLAFAAHGLELTQPFHDKRVVELALAIPEDLYFKDGRPRHLARTALADLLPPMFEQPPAGNIPFIPDYAGMIARTLPQLMAEIDRLEANPNLARYFDFPRMRAMLRAGPRDRRFGAPGYRMRQAARTFLCAHYIDRFRRDNA